VLVRHYGLASDTDEWETIVTQMFSDKLYSLQAAGDRLGGISRHTVRAWIKAGKLRPVRVGVRRLMLAETELHRFVASCNPSLTRDRKRG